VLLLGLAAFQYAETSSLQSQVSTLHAQVNGIPNDSTEIYQLQQQINDLQSRFTTSAQASSFKIVSLCIDASQSCPNTTGYVFYLTVQNTGAIPIPAGSNNAVFFMGGNGTSSAFGRAFNITTQSIPPGGTRSDDLTSWQSVFGAGNQPPFVKGETIEVTVCLSEAEPCQQMAVMAGG
jgi:archaellum component FlaG (FlaF/FlaG flagellin family)